MTTFPQRPSFPALPALFLGAAWSAAQDDVGVEFFENQVRPILATQCASCHGTERQKSGLRLDHFGSILAGGERGPAVVAGDLEKSLLVRAIRYDDHDLQMPPAGRLADEDIATLERWVEFGAAGPSSEVDPLPELSSSFDLEQRKQHWSFQPVRAVEPPAGTEWSTSEVDRFIVAKLQQADLEPAAEADRRTLLRRLAFDLTGLPPTTAEVESFAAAPGDPFAAGGAWDAAIDGYLDSERFGERWGRHWLDLVRYAESRGHEYDFNIPNAWQYRDWVVRAFNGDVAYDRFVLEHLAGDLLDEPRPNPEGGWDESVLGTGFWYLGEEVHSPVDIRTDQCDRIANQIDVMSKAFLGLTVACARCHDHKFDAITQADFYAFAGFAKSSRYRQVRFETRDHNARIADELAAERERSAHALVEAVRAPLRAGAQELAELLSAAGTALRLGPMPVEEGLPWPEDLDFLFEDFESGSWRNWIVEGEAIGDRPTRADEADLGDVGQRGQSYLNTWAVFRAGEMDRADSHLGSLTSPSFVIERDWIHFLIAGGAHEGETAFELVVEGEVVRTLSGKNSNGLEPGRFDVRELRGREAVLRAVDRHAEGWGQIALDHIVFSNDESAAALRTERWPAEELGWRERVWSVAAARGLDTKKVRALAEHLESVRDEPASPWYAFARAASSDDPAAALAEIRHASREDRERKPEELLFRAGSSKFSQDGFAFTRAEPGQVQLGRDLEQPLIGAFAEPVWASDPNWNVLQTREPSQSDPSLIEWTQAGRTLHTPSFRLGTPKLAYRVRGAGHVYAAVSGHRMLRLPLHGRLVRSWPDDGGWTWIVQDLTDYEGLTLHLEFSPADDGRLALGEVLQVAADWQPPASGSSASWRNSWRQRVSRAESLEELSHLYAGLLEMGIETLLEPERPGDNLAWFLLDAWLSEPDLLPTEELGLAAEPFHSEWSERERELLAQVRTTSQLAPATFDGSGVDEDLLARGSARSPKGPVPRRSLEALDGPDGIAIEHGSGRLELAQRLVDPTNPFVARVRVNRIWKHLLGRGLVPSVDDFGAMGEDPSHPDLLDWLANTFVAEGWSTKALIRRIVRSRVYRLASRTVDGQDELDPTNRWLHRAHVRRLEGEIIRDAILAVSGGLDTTAGGPPVPIHLTEFSEGRGRPSGGPLDGEGRRSIYLSVRRNFLSPFFLVFDAPTPATTVGRRSSSNVPAQALTLLNDPFVLAEAERWAHSLAERGVEGDEERLETLFLEGLSRPPTDEERKLANDFLIERRFGADGGDEWTDLAHVLFNVKEFVYLR